MKVTHDFVITSCTRLYCLVKYQQDQHKGGMKRAQNTGEEGLYTGSNLLEGDGAIRRRIGSFPGDYY